MSEADVALEDGFEHLTADARRELIGRIRQLRAKREQVAGIAFL